MLVFLAAAYVATFELHVPDRLIGSLDGSSNDMLDDKSSNDILVSSITILTFGIIFSMGGWIIRTHDKKKEFKDSFWQQNETLFSNALQRLFDKGNQTANILGLIELIKLRQAGVIDKELIDRATSSELPLEGANLSGANLSGANLSGANLSGADLYHTNLRGADLTGMV